MIRHPLIAIVAVFTIASTSQVLARAGGAGHGGASMGARAGGAMAGGAVRGSVVAGGQVYRSGAFGGHRSFSGRAYGRYGGYGPRGYQGAYAGSGAYGVAPFGTPTYVAAGVFVPGNPTQTPVSPPAIYQIERSGVVSRTGGRFTNYRRPGIYPVGISDGVQPSIYVVRVPRG